MRIEELIARLDAATEGSSELDWWIYLTATERGRDEFQWPAEHLKLPWPHWIENNPIKMLCPHDYDEGRRPYTRSIDAALTLLPEGFAVRDLMIWPGQPSSLTVYGTKLRGGEYWHHFGDGRWEARAGAPALAICIAALRARSESQ